LGYSGVQWIQALLCAMEGRSAERRGFTSDDCVDWEGERANDH
jgi:hypothetical protein